MLKPVAASITANTASWNQSIPKYHRYSGTAVSVRTNVPIKNELVIQLMRLTGIRKIKAAILGRLTGSLIPAENNVLLFPGMYAAAVFAGELLFFEFGCCPAFFFDFSSGIGQLCRGMTPHEQ